MSNRRDSPTLGEEQGTPKNERPARDNRKRVLRRIDEALADAGILLPDMTIHVEESDEGRKKIHFTVNKQALRDELEWIGGQIKKPFYLSVAAITLAIFVSNVDPVKAWGLVKQGHHLVTPYIVKLGPLFF